MEGNFLGSSSSSSSTRKGKGKEKTKPPQRGLGVAELEKIRIRDERSSNRYKYSCVPSIYPAASFHQMHEDVRMQPPATSFYNYLPNRVMSLDEYERIGMAYKESQAATRASWNPNRDMLQNQHSVQPGIAKPFLGLHVENPNSTNGNKSAGPSNQIPESRESQEPDLELRH